MTTHNIHNYLFMMKRKLAEIESSVFTIQLKTSSETLLLTFIESNFDELVVQFGCIDLLIVKVDTAFSNTELSENIVRILNLNAAHGFERFTNFLTNFSSELVSDITSVNRDFLIYCMTFNLGELGIQDISITSLQRCLSCTPLEFVTSFLKVAEILPYDQNKFLFSLACLMVKDTENNACNLSCWRLKFLLWFFKAACDSKHSFSPLIIYRAIRYNLDCIHDGIAELFLAYLSSKSEMNSRSILTLVYFDSALLLTNNSLPFNSRALLRFWICISEVLLDIFEEAPKNEILLSCSLGTLYLIPIVKEAWKSFGLDDQTNIARTILAFIDKSNFTNQQKTKFFVHIFGLLSTVLANKSVADPRWLIRNIDFIMRTCLQLEACKEVWDTESTMNDHFLDDMASVFISNSILMSHLSGSGVTSSKILGYLTCMQRICPDLLTFIDSKDTGRCLLLRFVAFHFNQLYGVIDSDGRFVHFPAESLRYHLSVLRWLPDRLCSDIYNILIHPETGSEAIKSSSSLFMCLSGIPQPADSIHIKMLIPKQILDITKPISSVYHGAELGFLDKSENQHETGIPIYLRKATQDALSTLDTIWESLNLSPAVCVTGSPGRGKSVSTALWVFHAANHLHVPILWVHKNELDLSVVIATSEMLLCATISYEQVHELLRRSCCSIAVFDGATKEDTTIVKAFRAWGSRSPQRKTMTIIVSSDGYISREKNSYDINFIGWHLDDYRLACEQEKVFESFIDLCNRDSLMRSQFSLDDNRRFSAEDIDELIEEKFKYTGGNARFMFDQTTESVRQSIEKAVGNLPVKDFGLDVGGKYSNTIFVLDENGYRKFVSNYAEECFMKSQSMYSIKERWHYAKQQGRAVLGTLFERIIIETISKVVDISVKVWDELKAVWKDEILKNNSCMEYDKDTLMKNGMSDQMRMVLSCNPPIKMNGNIHCRICLDGSKTFKTLETFAAHLNCHLSNLKKMKIDQSAIENNTRRYLNGSPIPLDCIDLSMRSPGLWLVPKNPYTPVFDFIYLRDGQEIWFFQATVSDFHEITDTDYLKKTARILNPNPLIKKVLIFLSPVDSMCKFSNSQKQKLAKEGIQWRQMSLQGYPFESLTANS